MNPYINWLKQNRDRIKREHFPNRKSGLKLNQDIVKKAGELWRNMPEQEKYKYKSLSNKISNKVKKTKKIIRNAKLNQKVKKMSNNVTKSIKNLKIKNKISKVSKKTSKKLSPYFKFLKEVRPKLTQQFKNLEVKERFTKIGKEAGRMWRNLTENEKKKYKK